MVSLSFRLSFVSFLCTAALAYQSAPAQAQISSDPAEASISGDLVWSTDDSLIAVGTDDGLWLHDSSDLSLLGHIAAGETVYSPDISGIDDRIAMGMDNGIVEIWDLKSQTQLVEVVVVADNYTRSPVRFLDWSPNGSLITSHAWGSPGRIWDAATGQVILEFPNVIYEMNWSPAGDEFVAVIEDAGDFGIWNTDGELLRILQDVSVASNTAWSPDGTWIAGGFREQLYVWRADTGELTFETEAILRPSRGHITAIAWHPNSQFFASHDHRRIGLTELPDFIQIWSVEDFSLVHEMEVQSRPFVDLGQKSIAWSHSGDRFAAVSGDGHLYMWDAETFELLEAYDGYRPERLNN
jgi:WD40 repeat protein